jgi:hypothetical protein
VQGEHGVRDVRRHSGLVAGTCRPGTSSTELYRPVSHGVGGAAEQVDHAPLDFAAQSVPVDVGRQLVALGPPPVA